MSEGLAKVTNFVRGRNYKSVDGSTPPKPIPMNQSEEDQQDSAEAANSSSSSRPKVRCPTCNGIGWVRKEEQGQLVALIPLNDHRLKPRRTVIYVLLAVALCLLAGGLCCFFLYPRDVTLDSNRPIIQPSSVDFKNDSVTFSAKNFFNLSNANFYPTYVQSIKVSAIMNRIEIAKADWTASGNGHPEVAMRSTLQLSIDIPFDFNADNAPALIARCQSQSPYVYNLFMTFAFNVEYSALGHVQEVSKSFLQELACHPPREDPSKGDGS